MNEKILAQTERKNTQNYYDERATDAANGRNGASRRHSLINTNTIVAIGSRIRGSKCEIYSRDMCVQLNQSFSLYPDIVIVANEPKFSNDAANVLVNPTLVVEIFSKKSAHEDKTIKLEQYIETESIKEILLISEDEMRVEHYFKQNQRQWVYRIYNSADDIISLDSVNCKVSLAEIYTQVRLDEPSIKSQAIN